MNRGTMMGVSLITLSTLTTPQSATATTISFEDFYSPGVSSPTIISGGTSVKGTTYGGADFSFKGNASWRVLEDTRYDLKSYQDSATDTDTHYLGFNTSSTGTALDELLIEFAQPIDHFSAYFANYLYASSTFEWTFTAYFDSHSEAFEFSGVGKDYKHFETSFSGQHANSISFTSTARTGFIDDISFNTATLSTSNQIPVSSTLSLIVFGLMLPSIRKRLANV